MTFWRSKTLLLVLLLAWITPAVALGGLAVHLELEHGHDHATHSAHHHGHQDPQTHGEHHHHPVASGALSCDPAEAHRVHAHPAHVSDGAHHHHALGLPGHDHELLPARGPVRLDTPSAQAVPPVLPKPVARPSSPGRAAPPVAPSGPASPLLLTTVLLL